MCIMSAVYDHFSKRIPQPWEYRPPYDPFAPSEEDIAKKTIDAFKKARDAAKVVDELTGQPDCHDPDKAKLEDRVVALEKRIADLEAKRPKKRTRKPKK